MLRRDAINLTQFLLAKTDAHPIMSSEDFVGAQDNDEGGNCINFGRPEYLAEGS